MARPSPRKTEPIVEATPRPHGDVRVSHALQLLALLVLALSLVALVKPEWRLWAVHQFAFMHIALAAPVLLLAAVLISPLGVRLVSLPLWSKIRVTPLKTAGAAFVVFMLCSVYGSLLGDGQLSITRLAHVGDMSESGKPIPRGRFFSQKEPGTMILHEGAFRLGMALAGPEIYVAPGRAGQKERVERQLIYRGIAQWCYRILSSLAGAVLVYALMIFLRKRDERDRVTMWFALLASGAWLTFFGYVENYALVTVAMLLFLFAGLRAAEPPRRLPLAPISLFALACVLHFMAIVLLPALVFLLWTLHVEPRDIAEQRVTAPRRRLLMLVAAFAVLGITAFFYLEAWDGWSGFIPLLPRWTKDGYAMLSVKHGVDLLNLALWGCAAATVILFLSRSRLANVQQANQEYFLLLAAGSGALFACVFSPNLGMARDWDIVTSALWPLIFYGAWRLAHFEFEAHIALRLRASLLALTVLVLLPAVIVQARPDSAVNRFKALLELDRSRSAYGWENLALYYQRLGLLDERIDAWTKAAAIDGNPRYLFNLAEAFKLADRIDEADTTALAAARIDKKYAENLFYFAVAQAKRGRIDRTKVLVDAALELDPEVQYGKRMQTWANMAIRVDSIAKSGDVERAREMVEKLIQIDTTNSFWRDYALTLGK